MRARGHPDVKRETHIVPNIDIAKKIFERYVDDMLPELRQFAFGFVYEGDKLIATFDSKSRSE